VRTESPVCVWLPTRSPDNNGSYHDFESRINRKLRSGADFSRWSAVETSDTIVVGAGIVGCATAFWLARAGLSVTVIERDQLAQHASAVPASMLAPLDPADSDARVRAGWSSLEALREIESELEDVSKLEPRLGSTGLLRLAEQSDCDAMMTSAVSASDFGCQWYDRADLEAWDSRLDPRWHGGLWSPGESHVDGARLTRIFARGAEHYGARFEFGTRAVGVAMADGCVAGVLTEPDRLYAAGDVIICAGNWSGEIAHWVGATVTLEPVVGELFELEALRPNLPSCVSGGGVQMIPELGALWVGGGLAGKLEVSSQAETDSVVAGTSIDFDASEPAAERAGRVLCGVGDLSTRGTWVRSFGLTPDRMPLVGRVPNVEGVILATGHGQHGVLLSALTAAAIVELIVEGQISGEAQAFSPERFVGKLSAPL
jgi:glycine oxidase